MTDAAVYRTLWRWHFYAGLFVLPFLVTLSLSGMLYLFKPQVERYEERAFHGHLASRPVSAHQQVEAALAAHAGARLLDYRVPEQDGDAVMVRLGLANSGGNLEVFVAPDGSVVGAMRPGDRIMAFVKRFHSELLIGKAGNWLVELAANWAILLILSGLYLWWPRGRGPAGTLWPRVGLGRQIFLRDLHAVTGFWISGLVLVLLVSGLPWTAVWGSAFQTVRAEMGWVQGGARWEIGGEKPRSAAHGHHHGRGAAHAAAGVHAGSSSLHALDAMVANVRAEQLAYPAVITPPGAPGRFGRPGENVWTIRSDSPVAPQQVSIRYDIDRLQELSRERFQDRHVIDRVVGYGISWHEGQLFGWVSQLVGVLTALGLTTMAVSAFVLWRRRKPESALGAPLSATVPARKGLLVSMLAVFAALLPLLALSLAVVWVSERLVLSRLPRLALWLGMPARQDAT